MISMSSRRGAADDLDVLAAAPLLREPALESRQRVLQQRATTAEGMCDEAVAHFARRLGHARSEASDEDGRRPEGIRPWIEGRDHQCVAIELAAEVELRLTLPCVEDGLDGQGDLTHAGGGPRPGHTEAVLDVGPHL
jgi:hypothetical protein